MYAHTLEETEETNRVDLTKDTNAEPKVREAQRSAAKNVSTPNKVEGSESVIDEDSRDKDIMELKEQMQTLQKQNQRLVSGKNYPVPGQQS
jgi:hypothetical protein